MAIDPNTQYPSNTNAPDVNYPGGSARNIVVTGDNSGTPLDEAWVNDVWGLLQALLLEGGVTANGSPDTAVASQYLESLRNTTGAVFTNVANMVASESLVDGQRVATLGYYNAGDGGAAIYEVVPNGTGTDDGGLFIDITGSTKQAKLLHTDSATPEQFGAVVDGSTDNTAEMNALLAVLDTMVLIPGKTYVSSGVTTGNDKKITGGGTCNLAAGADVPIFTTGEACLITNVILDGQSANQTSEDAVCVRLAGQESTVECCELRDCFGPAVEVAANNCSVSNNFIKSSAIGIRVRNANVTLITGNNIRTVDYGVELLADVAGVYQRTNITANVFSSVNINWVLVTESGGTINNAHIAKANMHQGSPLFDYLDIKNNVIQAIGSGSPENSVVAGEGSTYHRRDGSVGTSFYIKESGDDDTGWTAFAIPASTDVSSIVRVSNYAAGVTSIIPPANARSGTLIAIGGGGSGANSENDNRSGGGGGAGGTSMTIWKPSDGTLSVQIGTGGAAPITNGTPGNDGVETWIDNDSSTRLATAGGGGGGADPTSGAGGVGGTSSDGIRNFTGGTGGPGFAGGGSSSAGGAGGLLAGTHPFVGNNLRDTFASWGGGGNGSESTETPPPEAGQDGRIIAFWSMTR